MSRKVLFSIRKTYSKFVKRKCEQEQLNCNNPYCQNYSFIFFIYFNTSKMINGGLICSLYTVLYLFIYLLLFFTLAYVRNIYSLFHEIMIWTLECICIAAFPFHLIYHIACCNLFPLFSWDLRIGLGRQSIIWSNHLMMILTLLH